MIWYQYCTTVGVVNSCATGVCSALSLYSRLYVSADGMVTKSVCTYVFYTSFVYRCGTCTLVALVFAIEAEAFLALCCVYKPLDWWLFHGCGTLPKMACPHFSTQAVVGVISLLLPRDRGFKQDGRSHNTLPPLSCTKRSPTPILNSFLFFFFFLPFLCGSFCLCFCCCQEIKYDKAVLATGSFPFVPPTPGVDKKGVFVYRTIEDLEVRTTTLRSLFDHVFHWLW